MTELMMILTQSLILTAKHFLKLELIRMPIAKC